jgi:hypothetical protein
LRNKRLNGANVNLEDKTSADGKSSKAAMKPISHAPENRWGAWVTDFGDFVCVDDDGNALGSNFTDRPSQPGHRQPDYRSTGYWGGGILYAKE